MSSGKLNLLILGYGAVGIIKSLHLERSGLAQVSALARSNAEACKRGIRIESTNPDVGTVEHFQPHKIYSTPAEAAQDSYDAVLISAKSLPDIRPTSETLKPFIPPASSQAKVPAIVLLQNGIGIEQEVQQAYPHASVLSAAIYTTTNAHAGEPYTVVNGALNKTMLGLYQGEPKAPLKMPAEQLQRGQQMLARLAEAFNKGGWKTEAVDDIFAARYNKNLWNCSWGVVNAIARAPGVMASINEENKPWTVPLVRLLLEELLTLARALGLDEQAVPEAQIENILNLTLNNKFPASFKPSIQVDLEQGNQIEVEPIVGYLTRKGEALGLQLPNLRFTYNILKLQQNFTAQRNAGQGP